MGIYITFDRSTRFYGRLEKRTGYELRSPNPGFSNAQNQTREIEHRDRIEGGRRTLRKRCQSLEHQPRHEEEGQRDVHCNSSRA
ncbi:hypothetical protein C725_1939 [Pacificimonas flava]|uniref:Uncharacterized protein n=1 Tax=Pacificimonas flava TaxID=1234595 RepID=M2U3F4_9SPHN|nr:hypothetical protein C725_1939 [Pacificimonas flava]